MVSDTHEDTFLKQFYLCRATLEGPDGVSSGWLVDGHQVPTRLQSQQGASGVMFWAGIMGSERIGLFSVSE